VAEAERASRSADHPAQATWEPQPKAAWEIHDLACLLGRIPGRQAEAEQLDRENATARPSDSDCVSKTGTIRFSTGQTSKTITVKVKGDKGIESEEMFLCGSPGRRMAC
jgi:hypothetical protein